MIFNLKIVAELSQEEKVQFWIGERKSNFLQFRGFNHQFFVSTF